VRFLQQLYIRHQANSAHKCTEMKMFVFSKESDYRFWNACDRIYL